MIKPKVKQFFPEPEVQIITLEHPWGGFKATVFNYGEPMDLSDEKVVRQLWKEQWERNQQSMRPGEVPSANPNPPEPPAPPTPIEPEPPTSEGETS